MQFFRPHLTFACCGCPMRSCQTAAVCRLPHCLSHSKLHRISFLPRFLLVIKGYYAPRFDIVLCPHSRTQSQIPGLNLLRHQVQLCTSTPTAPWYLRCAGRVVQDRSRQQHKNGPVGRLYLQMGKIEKSPPNGNEPCTTKTQFLNKWQCQ